MPDHDCTGGELATFVSHLECSLTGERYPAGTLHGLSRAGRPLLVRYDLDPGRDPLPRWIPAFAAMRVIAEAVE